MKELSKHFDELLWSKFILPALTKAESDLNKDFSDYVGLKNIVSDEYKMALSSIYEEKREWLKNIYFGDFKTSEERCLDMHKIAAIICRSIIRCKPFTFDVEKANEYKQNYKLDKDLTWIINNYFVNYKVAVNSAFLITLYDLYDKLGEKAREEQPNDKILEMIKNFSEHGFEMYRSSIIKLEHESFYKSVILNLVINDTNGRNFDYLGFATMCFQLQQNETFIKNI